jgi:hypothetical protein
MKLIIWVLWPAFAAAGVAEIVFFTLIDPQTLYLLGEPVEMSPMATYSLGFLFFWLICAGASLMTWFMLPADVKAMVARHASAPPAQTRRDRRMSGGEQGAQ